MHKYSYHLILDEWVGTVTFRGYVRPNVYKILSARREGQNSCTTFRLVVATVMVYP